MEAHHDTVYDDDHHHYALYDDAIYFDDDAVYFDDTIYHDAIYFDYTFSHDPVNDIAHDDTAPLRAATALITPTER